MDAIRGCGGIAGARRLRHEAASAAAKTGRISLADRGKGLRPRRRVRPWSSAVAVLALALLALRAPAASAQDQPSEYPVKAAFLLKFGPFVQWPATAFESAASPFVLCIVGDDPFGPALDQASAGQAVGGHPMQVRRTPRVERGGPACHVLYAAGSKAQSPAETLAALQGEPVLTVTDDVHDDGSRGVVHFVLHDGRIRFRIDKRAAAQNGLVISSKLLSLALDARSSPEGAP